MVWIRAVVAGILVPPILAGVYCSYLWLYQGANFNWRVLMMTVALAYWMVALLGIPATITLRLCGSMRLGRVVTYGAMLGVVTALLVFGLSGVLAPVEQALIFGCMGAVAGLATWWVLNPRNKKSTSESNGPSRS